jgi:hypothetical protein
MGEGYTEPISLIGVEESEILAIYLGTQEPGSSDRPDLLGLSVN